VFRGSYVGIDGGLTGVVVGGTTGPVPVDGGGVTGGATGATGPVGIAGPGTSVGIILLGGGIAGPGRAGSMPGDMLVDVEVPRPPTSF
jgi:hypothetical protein